MSLPGVRTALNVESGIDLLRELRGDFHMGEADAGYET